MGTISTSAITIPAAAQSTFKLVGFNNFVHTNPKSDHFHVSRFHHVEFWCGDATNTSLRFSSGFGMPLIAKSDLSTGNSVHASYLLRSGDINFLFTAPYSPSASPSPSSSAIPTFSLSAHRSFTSSHGLGVRAIAIEVDSTFAAFSVAVSRGAKPVSPPILLSDQKTAIAEVHLYGDVVLRFVSTSEKEEGQTKIQAVSDFFPGFEPVEIRAPLDYGIRQLDHAVGNVPHLGPVAEYLKNFLGFHELACFTAEDVGTDESGMNSVVLVNNDENVMLTVNDPAYGTKRKSNIETFLDHNEGAGVQHLALLTEDIFLTLNEMKKRSWINGGGFEFMPSPPSTYYANLKARAGDVLSDEQIKECEKLGVMVDRDHEGTILQILTKPVGDRPTIFIEIIQRIGCMLKDGQGKVYQKGGCGGFGKGNFAELYKSIEEYDKMLEAAKQEPFKTKLCAQTKDPK